MAGRPGRCLIVVFVAGLSLAVASANAVFRDVEFVVTALLLPWFFLTPILYQVEDLPGSILPVARRRDPVGNPMTPPVEAFRAPLYARCRAGGGTSVYLVVEAVVALAVGAWIFRSVDDRIAAEA